jgi:hypothetical protein
MSFAECGSAPANGEKTSTPPSRSAVSSWRESLPSIAQGGSGKFGGADATQNGQKPSLVVELDVSVSNEVTAMKVRIEYCVP